MTNFILKHKYHFLLATALLFVVFVSLATLTTKPRLWADEAKSIELALNFQRFGVLDIQTAPNEFSGISYLLQSTGYPVTVPLAGIFALFGFSMAVSRIYMLLWMIAALCGIFFFLKRVFGIREALFSVVLIATFASFHDNGRTVVGEIPGFLFMLLGLWLTLRISDFKHLSFEVGPPFLAGIFFGLAVVTKPSVYMAILPAITVALCFRGKTARHWFFEMCMICIGTLIPAILWFAIIVGTPTNGSFWNGLLSFWRNPFNAGSIEGNIIYNIKSIIFSTTLLYFGAFFIMLLATTKQFWYNEKQRIFFVFLVLYSALAFIYYLRSPGWLRYIIAAELLILMAVPYSIDAVMKLPHLRNIWHGASIALSVLIIVQTIHFFTSAQIYTSDSALRAGEYVNREFPHESVGVLDAITLGIFIDPSQKYQAITMVGLPQMGTNPLLEKNLPNIVISVPDNHFLNEAASVIKQHYVFKNSTGDYSIYVRWQ